MGIGLYCSLALTSNTVKSNSLQETPSCLGLNKPPLKQDVH